MVGPLGGIGISLLGPVEVTRNGEPVVDTFAMVPPAGIAELHMDPPNPVPHAGGHQLLGAVDSRTIEDVVAVAGPGSGSPLISFELRQLGGALARDHESHGVLSSVQAQFLAFGVGLTVDEASAAAVNGQLALIRGRLAGRDTGLAYSNFALGRTDPARFFGTEKVTRLRAVKAAVDPDGVFRGNHALDAEA